MTETNAAALAAELTRLTPPSWRLSWSEDGDAISAINRDGLVILATIAEIMSETDAASLIPHLIEAAAERIAWCEDWSKLSGRLTVLARPLIEAAAPLYCERWIAGSLNTVLAAVLESHIALIPIATAERLRVPQATLWQAAERNITRWFYQRNWTLQGRDDPTHTEDIVLALTDEAGRSSGIIAVPALVTALAREVGITDPILAVPCDGILLLARNIPQARRAIAARAGMVIRQTPNFGGVPPVTNEVFKLDQGRIVTASIIH